MINVLLEDIVTLQDATLLFPRRRRGCKPSFGCVWRWVTSGLHGVKLEAVKCGNSTCTSKQAIVRFVEQLTAKDVRLNPNAKSISTPGGNGR